MIHMVTDIVKLYTAMLLSYVLKWPYALKVIVCVEFIFFAVYLLTKSAIFLARKIGIPFLFGIFKYVIYILQWIIFQISKVAPKFQEKGGQFDEALNTLGMKSEEWHNKLKMEPLKKEVKRKVKWGGSIIVLAISIVFIIIPYYMEPVLSGSAKNACDKINQFSADFEGNIRSYADRYYTPAKSVISEEPEEVSIEEEGEKQVLHLGGQGYDGANLRSTPEKGGNVITIISGDIELFYENEMAEGDTTIWLKVSTEGIEEAWISKKVIREEDLEKIGIQ